MQGLVPCVLDYSAAISKVATGAEVQHALSALRGVQSKLAERKVHWQFDLKSIKSKNHCIAKQVLATLKDSPMVSDQDRPGTAGTQPVADSCEPSREAHQQDAAVSWPTDTGSSATEGAQPCRLQSHARSLSIDGQPAGSRKPGRSRGSERPPAGPLSPAPGRPPSYSNRRTLERPERPPSSSRPVSTMERSRSTSSLSSRGLSSPAPRPSAPRIPDKDVKNKSQVGPSPGFVQGQGASFNPENRAGM